MLKGTKMVTSKAILTTNDSSNHLYLHLNLSIFLFYNLIYLSYQLLLTWRTYKIKEILYFMNKLDILSCFIIFFIYISYLTDVKKYYKKTRRSKHLCRFNFINIKFAINRISFLMIKICKNKIKINLTWIYLKYYYYIKSFCFIYTFNIL